MLSTWKLRHLSGLLGGMRPGFIKGWATAHQPWLNQNFPKAAPIEKYSKPRQTPRNKSRDTSVVEQNCPPGHETHFRVLPLFDVGVGRTRYGVEPGHSPVAVGGK